MKKLLQNWSFKRHVIMALIVILVLLAINFTLPYILFKFMHATIVQDINENVVGIIGGADGLTAIFLASRAFGMKHVIFNGYTLVLIFLLIGYIPIYIIRNKISS